MELYVSQLFTRREWIDLTNQLGLSGRQAQIARCLLEGRGDKQVAHELGITVPTVRTYLGRMFVKLDVQDRNELIVNIFREFRTGCNGCPRQQ